MANEVTILTMGEVRELAQAVGATQAAEAERAAVVAHLRDKAKMFKAHKRWTSAILLEDEANIIEAGAHHSRD